MSARLARIAFERGALLGLVVLVAYLWLAPTHIVAGDNAEFATLGAVGGRAHPSGYPLYTLFLRATSWLPLGSAAARANSATALLAVAHVLMLHAACRAWGIRASAATWACAILAGAPLVLRVHTEADVFALNSLAASVILWLAAPRGPLEGTARTAALGLAAGLGLANNLTLALLAPIGIWGVVRGVREAKRVALPLAAAASAFVVGLLPYLYLFVAPDPASWAPVDSFGDLADLVLRKDYGYTSHLPGGNPIPIVTSLGGHAALVGRQWLWFPALAGLAALGLKCARDEHRVAWWMLAASWLLCGPVFAARLGVETSGVGAYIGGRMQLLSAVVLAVPVAAAFELVAERSRAVSARTAQLGAVAAFAALVVIALPRLQRVHSRAVEAGIAATLAAVPPASIVVVVSEDQCFGGRYLQLAQGARPDVTIVCAVLAQRAWYRERLARLGVRVDGTELTVGNGEALLATGRPLIVDGTQTVLKTARPGYPVGMLWRVLPRGARVPSLGEVLDAQRALFAGLDLDYPRPSPDDDFAAVAHKRYAGVWRDLSRALAAAGRPDDAAAALDVARQLAPD
ncbi:MAG: DUF2723 domain-containing protein [Myxococcales bacterium]|nr:DUF2723 domain-containing protein [Myxococcales bacterium]